MVNASFDTSAMQTARFGVLQRDNVGHLTQGHGASGRLSVRPNVTPLGWVCLADQQPGSGHSRKGVMTGWEASNARASRWDWPAPIPIDLAFVNLDDQVMVVLGKGRRAGRSRSAAYKGPSDGRLLCQVDYSSVLARRTVACRLAIAASLSSDPDVGSAYNRGAGQEQPARPGAVGWLAAPGWGGRWICLRTSRWRKAPGGSTARHVFFGRRVGAGPLVSRHRCRITCRPAGSAGWWPRWSWSG